MGEEGIGPRALHRFRTGKGECANECFCGLSVSSPNRCCSDVPVGKSAEEVGCPHASLAPSTGITLPKLCLGYHLVKTGSRPEPGGFIRKAKGPNTFLMIWYSIRVKQLYWVCKKSSDWAQMYLCTPILQLLVSSHGEVMGRLWIWLGLVINILASPLVDRREIVLLKGGLQLQQTKNNKKAHAPQKKPKPQTTPPAIQPEPG